MKVKIEAADGNDDDLMLAVILNLYPKRVLGFLDKVNDKFTEKRHFKQIFISRVREIFSPQNKSMCKLSNV